MARHAHVDSAHAAGRWLSVMSLAALALQVVAIPAHLEAAEPWNEVYASL